MLCIVWNAWSFSTTKVRAGCHNLEHGLPLERQKSLNLLFRLLFKRFCTHISAFLHFFASDQLSCTATGFEWPHCIIQTECRRRYHYPRDQLKHIRKNLCFEASANAPKCQIPSYVIGVFQVPPKVHEAIREAMQNPSGGLQPLGEYTPLPPLRDAPSDQIVCFLNTVQMRGGGQIFV